jgi:FG-GAP-like repeat
MKWVCSTSIKDTADFNRDGIADILLHNQSGDEVAMWMMGANGQVIATHSVQGQDGNTLKTGNLNWKVVGFADIDRDNILDIVWHNQQSDEVAFWFMNADGINVRSYDYLRDANSAILKTGNALWQAHTVADFDGDGDADLLFRLPELNQTAIVQLNGPSLVNYAYIASPTEVGFAIRSVGDSNGDRIADIYWQNAENTSVLIQPLTAQSQSNNFTPVVSIAPLQGIADLDLNNTNDLLFRSTGLLLDLVNPAQPQLLNTPLVQAGQVFQFDDINWNIIQTDDFGEVIV